MPLLKAGIYYKKKPVIWPIPNECNWKDGYLEIGDTVTISCPCCFIEETKLFAQSLEEDGVHVIFPENGLGLIQVVSIVDDRINDEGYILNVAADHIELASNTTKGIFYAFQSLVQLVVNSCDRNIPCVSIVDSPFKSVRGVHIYLPPRTEFTWFKRYIDFLGKYKYNTIYWEISGGMKYDSHPEINEGWVKFCEQMMNYPGGPSQMECSVAHAKDSSHIENARRSYLEKPELKELIDYIRKRHFEIIPEMQSLSHSYWLLMSHKELAEKQDDPYTDTYCPSNEEVYGIYFDCLQEVIDLFKPEKISIGHDEIYYIGMCDKCKRKTGHELLAEDVAKIHHWLAERGIRTVMWGDKLLQYRSAKGRPEAGSELVKFSMQDQRNIKIRATYRAVDSIPQDIMILDWAHSMSGEDTKSQDYFYRRGMEVVFGNFDDNMGGKGIPNIEDRLRRSNVLGAECSLWHEVSDLGMALKDSLPYYLDSINILWFEGYRRNKRNEYNPIISQIYPAERDKLNGIIPVSRDAREFRTIDISGFYNIPLNWINDCSFILTAEKIPNTVPFNICKAVRDCRTDAACILVEHQPANRVDGIQVNEKLSAISFLHAYSMKLGNIPLHYSSYFGLEDDVVGYYIIHYGDSTYEKIALEYSRNITSIDNEFGAYWANPVYQTSIAEGKILEGRTSKSVSIIAHPSVVFSFEWRNSFPEKKIVSIGIEHCSSKKGGILVFAVTGIC